MNKNKNNIIASAHKGTNFALAAELLTNPTKALVAEATRLTSPTRTKPVRAHEVLCAALALAEVRVLIAQAPVRASKPLQATKSDQIRAAARAAAPAGKGLATVNRASRIAANNPRWGVKRVVTAALAEVAPSWSNSDWAHLDANA